MSLSLIVSLAWVLLAIVTLVKSLLIAGESQRFALFRLGRFNGYVGPGLVVILPFLDRAFRLEVGDTGVLISTEFATFSNVQVPVPSVGRLRVGSSVRIASFDESGPQLEAAPIGQFQRCPKCGHQY
jgi:regulator of protease activity HflC (stomatin/prohibitin superfamily)